MDVLTPLIKEIEQLKYELYVVIPQDIQSAMSLGDLRENSDYSTTIERQNFINIRLKQLIYRVESYSAIDFSSLPRDMAHIGSIVKLRNLKTNKTEYVKIVITDIDETDVHNQVTIGSPIGASLKNRKIDEEILVQLPIGTVKYKILEINTIHDM